MKLFFRKTGEGKPLLILHGLFGSGDNWATLAKVFADEGFCCYVVDQRNHGKSPHSEVFTYESMASDLEELMNDEHIQKADLLGHSMGGKTAMFFASLFPEKINKLIVADIAPKYYPQHHQAIFSALKSIDTSTVASRKEAEGLLRAALNDESTIQFLLKNLYWKEGKSLDWRFGLLEIENNIENIGKAFKTEKQLNIKTLFLKGERSGYINENDETEIKIIFPNSEIKTIPDAGHWVHAENPKNFMEVVLRFLNGDKN